MTDNIYSVKYYLDLCGEILVKEDHYLGLKNAFKCYKTRIKRDSCIEASIYRCKFDEGTGKMFTGRPIVTHLG